ncbi:MAG: transporter, partial [Bdellovibrionota bacterium]
GTSATKSAARKTTTATRTTATTTAAPETAMTASALASDQSSNYTLMNPAPASEMGTMQTERTGPAVTPNTMAPGHYSIEMTAVSYGYTRVAPGFSMKNLQVAPFSVRAGLIANTEANAGINYLHSESTTNAIGAPTARSSIGSMHLGTKTKLITTDMTPNFELAVMPTLDLPFRTAETWNLGVSAPMSFHVVDNWTFGAQAGLQYLGIGEPGGGTMVMGTAGTIARSINDQVDVFGGLDSRKSLSTNGAWVANLNMGAGYSFTTNFRVDAGTNVGLSTAAQDINPYLGAAVRF